MSTLATGPYKLYHRYVQPLLNSKQLIQLENSMTNSGFCRIDKSWVMNDTYTLYRGGVVYEICGAIDFLGY